MTRPVTILLLLTGGVTTLAAADDSMAVLPREPSQPPRRSLRVPPDPLAPFEKGLATKVSVDFEDAPLRAVVDHLAKAGDLDVLIDEFAFHEEGVSLDEPIDLLSEGATVEDLLNRTLNPLGLVWIVRSDALEITSELVADEISNWVTQVYDVHGLLEREDRAWRVLTAPRSFPGSPVFQRDPTWLESVILKNTDPLSWSNWGGAGHVHTVGGTLVIRQSPRVHERIDRLLVDLLELSESPPGQPTRWPWETETEERLRTQLDQRLDVDFDRTPLRDTVRRLGDATDADFVIDEIALAEEGVPLDEPITYRQENVRLRFALHAMLDSLILTWTIRDDAMVVTSTVVAEGKRGLPLAIVDVRDIRARSESPDAVVEAVIETHFTWDGLGDEPIGSITPALDGFLVMRHVEPVIAEIEETLRRVRRVSKSRPERRRPTLDDVRVLDYTLDEHDPREVANLIRTLVDPGSWGEDESLLVVGRQLFVRTTLANHERIQELLSELKPVTPKPAP